MYIPLPDLHLTFTDFILLAIVLAIMYSTTLLEALGTVSGREAAGISLQHRKGAASWAFAGIGLTLLAGIAAAAQQTPGLRTPFVLVPLTFMGHWAYFHWRSSKLIDVQLVFRHFDDAYKRAILKTLEGHPMGLSEDQIRQHTLQSDVYLQMLKVTNPLLKSAVPLPVAKVLDTLLPSEDKTGAILVSLAREGAVRQDGSLFYRSPTP